MPRHIFKAVGHENGQTKTNFTGKNYDLLPQFCIIFGVSKKSSGKKIFATRKPKTKKTFFSKYRNTTDEQKFNWDGVSCFTFRTLNLCVSSKTGHNFVLQMLWYTFFTGNKFRQWFFQLISWIRMYNLVFVICTYYNSITQGGL